MRYILDNEGYIESIAFGSYIECNNKSCTEYTGSIPTGYNSLCEWADNANIRAYYLVDGNLTYDSVKDQELQAKWEQESQSKPQETVTIIDNLESTSATDALSANQGRILNEKFSNLNESPKYITTGEEFATNEYIDGKRVYEKIFSTNETIKGQETTSFKHNITGVEKIWIDLSNSYIMETTGKCYHLPVLYYSDNTVDGLQVFVDLNNLYFISNGGWGYGWTKVVRLRYTKKTETSFKVFGYDYQAEEGMTWDDFINSSYNNSVFAYTETGNIYCKNYTTNNLVCLESDTSNPIKGDKVISNGDVYTIYPKPSPTPV